MSEKQTASGRRLKVTLVKSPIGYNASQAKVVQSLGLRRMHHSVEVLDHPAMREMLHKVRHLVRVEE
jgi:large subunit ribosomal protein L30